MMLLKVVCWGGVIAAIREAETWRDPERREERGKSAKTNLDRFFGGDKSFSARLRGWPNRLESSSRLVHFPAFANNRELMPLIFASH